MLAFAVAGVTIAINRGNVFLDLAFYGRWASNTLSAVAIPYADFKWEYPPAALPGMMPPALLSAPFPTWNYVPYTLAWVAMVLLLDAVILRTLVRRLGSDLKQPALQLWILGLPILGGLSWARFDLLPATAALAAVLYAGSRREVSSGLVAGLGACLKLWPILLAPIQRTRRRSLTAASVAVGFVVAIALTTFQLTGSTGFSQVLGYQSDRGLQIESLAALPLVWMHHLEIGGIDTRFAFGAWEVTGAGVPMLARIATVVFLASLVLVGLAHWRLMRVDAGRRGVAITAVTMMLVILVTNKVFSPQYVLWLIAVVVAAAALDPSTWRPFVKPVLLLAALTHVVFPWFYGDVLFGAWFGLLVMTARDVVLVWLLVKVVRLLWTEVRSVRDREVLMAASGLNVDDVTGTDQVLRLP